MGDCNSTPSSSSSLPPPPPPPPLPPPPPPPPLPPPSPPPPPPPPPPPSQVMWVNKNVDGNCFMLYARALSITSGEDPHYWKWIQLQESSGTMIEAAELKTVHSLEVHGRLDTRKLTAGVLYEVRFHVMLKDPAQGWEVPVNVRLVLPGGKKQEHKENLISKMKGQWIEIPVGQFVAPAHHEGGEMEFSLYEIEGEAWKQGLVIKGVSIEPNSHDYRISLE